MSIMTAKQKTFQRLERKLEHLEALGVRTPNPVDSRSLTHYQLICLEAQVDRMLYAYASDADSRTGWF